MRLTVDLVRHINRRPTEPSQQLVDVNGVNIGVVRMKLVRRLCSMDSLYLTSNSLSSLQGR